MRLLDAGCGTGELLRRLHSTPSAYRLFGVDAWRPLCHENVDPHIALQEARRCLRAEGVLVLNLPAYQWLLSYHDERVRNVRRFTRRHLLRLLDQAGFTPLYATYWNMLLFPVMALRWLVVRPAERESDVHLYPPAVERLLGALLTCERVLLRAGARLPFGWIGTDGGETPG